MSQLPPDLMRRDRDPDIGAENDALDLPAPQRSAVSSEGHARSSRLPMVFSSLALMMSLAAGGLVYLVYEKGTRAASSELAAMDRRLTEVEMRVAQFTGDIDLKLLNLSDIAQELKNDVASLKSDVDAFRAHAVEQDARLSGIEGAVADIDKLIKSRSARIAPKQSTANKQSAAKAARTTTTPKHAANVELLSVRSIGDIAVVRIGNHSGQSPLLQIGDRWQQWEFTGLDGASVQFKHDGHDYRLAL